jgi:hypothetical protein
MLSACGGSGNGDALLAPGGGDVSSSTVQAADLCVNNGCGEAIQLIAIPDAENILFAPDGRLFVSGGQNVYEITKDGDGSYAATPLSAQQCSFTGMAIRDGVLYAIGCGNQLLAGLLTAQPVLEPVYQFQGMCIANGMALGPDGRLYVVDEPLNVNPPAECVPPDPKIVRLAIDPADPMHITQQEVWVQGSPLGLLFLGLDNVLRFPNGIVRDGNTFYATDGGSVFSVELLPDGSAGPVTPLFFEPTAHDDLGLGGVDGLLVSDFFKGRILLLSRSGELLQETDPFTFTAVSSVRLGQPPMFQPTDILVTDKGVIGDNNLPIDYLMLFRRRAGAMP